MSRQLRVLVACEMSGRVRTQFAKRGWIAWSADLLPDESPMWNPAPRTGTGYGFHYQGDVRDLMDLTWDLVIAHPPCDRLTNAGARWWKQWQADGSQQEAIDFFWEMYGGWGDAYVAVENPRNWIGAHQQAPDQIVEPWMFGEPLRKKTCLWYHDAWLGDRFDSLPDLVPTHTEADYDMQIGRVATGGGSWRTDSEAGRTGMNNWEDSQGRARRKILRSITSSALAKAMAVQWGSYIEHERGIYPLAG